MTGPALREAEVLREQGEIAEARRRCEALVAAEPGNAAALSLLAALAADENDHEGALHWADQASAADAKAAAPHYTMGRIYQAQGDHGRAERAYRRALSLD